jgi:hypothetical protein
MLRGFALLQGTVCHDLNLLKPRQALPDATIAVPFHDCIFFVRALNGAEFSSRLAEVAQTLDPVAGSQMLAGRRRLDKRRLLGSVRIRSGTAVRQWRLGGFTQFRYRAIGEVSRVQCFLPRGMKALNRNRSSSQYVQHKRIEDDANGLLCTVLTINFADTAG